MTRRAEHDATAPAAAAVAAAPHAPDGISVRRWFAFYGLLLLAACVPLAMLVSGQSWTLRDWLHRPAELLPLAPRAAKLLAFGIYVSLCCTFLPLPANWVVAALAMRNAAVAPNVWATTLVVAAVGATASTLANLNDYHLFTWMLRHRRIGSVRDTRLYRAAAGWFARSPFLILVAFNVVPIPVDVVRMLATTYRYGRAPFAAANYLGRFIRFGVIAHITYSLGGQGKWAVAALLGVAVALGAAKVLPAAARRILRRPANPPAAEVSASSGTLGPGEAPGLPKTGGCGAADQDTRE